MTAQRLITALALLFSTFVWAAEDNFPGIKKLMTPEEYNAAGLDKLSDPERDALNQWLINYTVEEAPVMLRSNPEVKQAEEEFQITAQILPPFKGWTGDTVFKLDNGQIWRQRLDGRYSYNGNDTRVVIKKNFFGFFKMTMESTGAAVGVTRLK